MRKSFNNSRIIFLALAIIFFITCKKDDPKIVKEKISGQVQKGPYVNGTSISMAELNSSLSQTGNIFTTQLTSNTGSFQIDNISLTSSYVEFNANGYYFDEVKGDLSIAPLNLFALSDIRDISTVNVNIMTHLEKQRVAYLIKQNKSFSEAKKSAQGEILSIFGFSLIGISNSETLDISVNSESNAILLAISVILQGNRSVGDLTELLANISNDIKEDGKVTNPAIITDLRSSAKLLKLATIRSNLEKRYQDLGITTTIPGFEKYVYNFLAFTGEKPFATTQLPTDVAALNVTLNGTVNPNSLSTIVFFEWGKTIAYGDSINAAQSPSAGSSSTNVSKTLSGILPGTVYHFRVKARNSKGTTYGDDLSFTTLGQIPTITTLAVSNLKATSATINAIVNPNLLNTTVTFKWGKTTNYTDSIKASQSPVSGSSPLNVSADLTGLTKSTSYYFQVYSTNQLGTTVGDVQTFVTLDGLPVLTTMVANPTSPTSTTGGGNITYDGGYVITSRGLCLSTNNNPTVNDNKMDIGSGSGQFMDTFTGLIPGTNYNIRAFATNINGTSYGNQVTFRTYDADAPFDMDNNYYKTVTIGSQIWMAENLKTTKYRNGDAIPNVTDNTSWGGLTTAAYCFYNNDQKNNDIYGALYNFYAVVDSRNICPSGWHVPTNAEWLVLEGFVGGPDNNSMKFKETGTAHWISPNYATNETGFTALPGGYRVTGFATKGTETYWWSSTASDFYGGVRYIVAHNNYFGGQSDLKHFGHSVRCLKD